MANIVSPSTRNDAARQSDTLTEAAIEGFGIARLMHFRLAMDVRELVHIS
jgi:hypothetical protein